MLEFPTCENYDSQFLLLSKLLWRVILKLLILSIPTFFQKKMSKISYSYFALRGFTSKKSDCVLSKQLSKKLQEKEKRSDGKFSHSQGYIPMVSGGFNVYAPGHIVLKKSTDVKNVMSKKSDCVLSKQLSNKLQEKGRRFYSDFITNPKPETEVSKTPLPEKEITNLTNFIDLSKIPDTKDKRDYDSYPPIKSIEKSKKYEKLVGIGKDCLIDTTIRYSKQETEDYISFKPDTHLRNDLYPPTRSPIVWEPKSKVLKPKKSESISNQCQNLGKSTNHYKSGIPSPEMKTTGSESPKNPSNKPIETIEFPKETVEKDITDESHPEGNISRNNSKFEAWIEKINPDKPSLPSNFEFPKDGSFGTNI